MARAAVDKLPLSVAIIAFNAAEQIGPCLASVEALADEILVVDSGSTDATAEVAARHGARVVQKEWLGFGRQKQYAVFTVRVEQDIRLDDQLA